MAKFEDFSRYLRIKTSIIRELLAELLGTFCLIVIGCGSVAQYKIMGADANILSIYLGWGGGVCLAVMVAGGVSGAHLNPAVSLALATLGKFSWVKVIPYMAAQYLGAFIASVAVFYVYKNGLDTIDPDRTLETAGIWATYPKGYLSIGNAFADQVLGTGLLLLFVLAVTDEKNMAVPKGMVGPMVGIIIATLGMSFGINCGYALNPARDLGPRFFTFVAGYGPQVFTAFEAYSWVPFIAPHVGAVLGAWVYMMFIGFHWPDQGELNLPDTIVQWKEKANDVSLTAVKSYPHKLHGYQ